MQSTLTDLRCEYCVNPMGIDVTEPRFSWRIEDSRRGARQVSYRLFVATDPAKLKEGEADLWDSGLVASDRSIHVAYAGQALLSRQRAYWAVIATVTGADEREVVCSSGTPASAGASASGASAAPPAFFEIGLLGRQEWKAQWIQSDLAGGHFVPAPAPYLRKAFTVDKPVASARLYATALGVYIARLNGQRVGDDVFTPGWTEYRKRVQYQVYDVTAQVRQGDNALGIVLGDGWYAGHVGSDARQTYGDRPRAFAQLEVRFADGSVETIATDPSWRFAFGPILASDMIRGESYDARRELTGWDLPGLDDSAWRPVECFPDPAIAIVATDGTTVRRQEEVRPVKITKTWGHFGRVGYIVDLGQNLVGWVRLRMKGEAGKAVALRHAEMLDKEGRLYMANLRSASPAENYVLQGDPNGEVYEPSFTFHGFRYVEVTGYPGELTENDLTAIVVHSDMERTGEFECSDPLVNQLQSNIRWGQKGNYLEVPTDCPQRDERLGWTGDAQVFVRTGAFNYNVAPFFTKWQQDLADAQGENGSIPPVIPNPSGPGGNGGPAWADAHIICPWTMYLCYGDTRLLARHYDSLRKWVDSLEGDSRNLIRSYEGGPWGGFGDWLATDNGRENVSGRTPCEIIGTAFYAYSSGLLAKIAGILGKTDDAAKYCELSRDVREAFIKRFVTGEGLLFGDTQTAYVLALHFGLLPVDLRPLAAEALIRLIRKNGMHLTTGFVGSPYLNHVLTATGHLDVAYTLLLQKTAPSWLYAVTQGATTIWERWDGWTHDKGFQDPGMNSFNHYAYGAIGAWLYQSVAGIDADPERPGYKHILVRPQLAPAGTAGLTHARASLKSLYGTIESAWRLEGAKFTLEVTIPPNTTATIHLPGLRDAVREAGQPLRESPGLRVQPHADDKTTVVEVGSGTYRFTTDLK
jgi:alpha-L-rhamnosidase